MKTTRNPQEKHRRAGTSLVTFSLLALLLTSLPANALAKPQWIIKKDGSRGHHHLDGVLGFDFDVDTVVPGIWYGLPILKDGFLPINDSFEAEFGGFIGLGDVNYLLPAGGVRWSFHLLEVWDVFATLKLGYILVDGPGDELKFGGSVGGDWYFSKSLGLRFETSTFGRHASFLTAGLTYKL